MKREKGIVVTIMRKKGFGFIKPTEGEEIFFHADAVCDPEFKDLREGYRVEYLIKDTPKGPKAIGVTATL